MKKSRKRRSEEKGLKWSVGGRRKEGGKCIKQLCGIAKKDKQQTERARRREKIQRMTVLDSTTCSHAPFATTVAPVLRSIHLSSCSVRLAMIFFCTPHLLLPGSQPRPCEVVRSFAAGPSTISLLPPESTCSKSHPPPSSMRTPR
eukprot:767444-Hanusia_phi.AAC.6